MKNLVSVVIPSYNHESYIQKAVESVFDQTHTYFELIVIDDGSTDKSLDYLRSVRDSRFKLIEQDNGGAHNAINRGLNLAKGEYLAILNSDDVYHPRRLENCLTKLQEGVDLVASWIEVIDRKGKVLGIKEGWRNMLPWPIEPPEVSFSADDKFLINLLLTNFVSTTSNIVFSRHLYESIGGMKNLRFAHDWDFLLRAARQFRCELLESPLLQYRIHQTNTISSDRAWMLYEICWIYAVHLQAALSKLTFHDNSKDIFPKNILSFLRAINLQGNDKVLWFLLLYIQRQTQLGNPNPEDSLIEDVRLRSFFVNQILCN